MASLRAVALSALLLTSCSSNTSPAPTVESLGSQAPTQAAPSAQPADTPSPSERMDSPSPSQWGKGVAPEAEALIPDEIAGVTLHKQSFRGLRGQDPDGLFEAQVLDRLGRAEQDYSGALGISMEPSLPISIGVYRYAGVAREQLKDGFLQAVRRFYGSTAPGPSPDFPMTSLRIGGEDVTFTSTWAGEQYFYFTDEAAIGVTSDDRKAVAAVIRALAGSRTPAPP